MSPFQKKLPVAGVVPVLGPLHKLSSKCSS